MDQLRYLLVTEEDFAKVANEGDGTNTLILIIENKAI